MFLVVGPCQIFNKGSERNYQKHGRGGGSAVEDSQICDFHYQPMYVFTISLGPSTCSVS